MNRKNHLQLKRYLIEALALLSIIAVFQFPLFITAFFMIIMSLKLKHYLMILNINKTAMFKKNEIVYKWDGKDHEFIEKTNPELAIRIDVVSEDFYLGQYVNKKETVFIPFEKQTYYWTNKELEKRARASAQGQDFKRNL